MRMSERWRRTCADWAVQSYYQRFESAVALVLTALITLIILVALYRLAATVIAGLLLGVLDPLDYGRSRRCSARSSRCSSRSNSTIRCSMSSPASRASSTKVVLIALLALARKFIILDVDERGSSLRPRRRHAGARGGLLADPRARGTPRCFEGNGCIDDPSRDSMPAMNNSPRRRDGVHVARRVGRQE